jgi:hypothetical protein
MLQPLYGHRGLLRKLTIVYDNITTHIHWERKSHVYTIVVCCNANQAARAGADLDAMMYCRRLWQQ